MIVENDTGDHSLRESPDSADVARDGRFTSTSENRLRIFLLSRPEEIELVLPLIAEAHAESPFKQFPFSAEKARRRIRETLANSARQAGFYVLHRERVVGIVGVGVGPYYLSDDGIVATCLTIYVAANIRKSLLGAKTSALLTRAMKNWARAKGAELLAIHGTNGHVGRMARGSHAIGVNVLVPLR